jgi:hypothetical protein
MVGICRIVHRAFFIAQKEHKARTDLLFEPFSPLRVNTRIKHLHSPFQVTSYLIYQLFHLKSRKYNLSELFTDRGYSSGEEVAHEAVVNYREPTQPNPSYNEADAVRSVRP